MILMLDLSRCGPPLVVHIWHANREVSRATNGMATPLISVRTIVSLLPSHAVREIRSLLVRPFAARAAAVANVAAAAVAAIAAAAVANGAVANAITTCSRLTGHSDPLVIHGTDRREWAVFGAFGGGG